LYSPLQGIAEGSRFGRRTPTKKPGFRQAFRTGYRNSGVGSYEQFHILPKQGTEVPLKYVSQLHAWLKPAHSETLFAVARATLAGRASAVTTATGGLVGAGAMASAAAEKAKEAKKAAKHGITSGEALLREVKCNQTLIDRGSGQQTPTKQWCSGGWKELWG
jgi:hypothetical protein